MGQFDDVELPPGEPGQRSYLRRRDTYAKGKVNIDRFHVAKANEVGDWRTDLEVEVSHTAPSTSFMYAEGGHSGQNIHMAARDLDTGPQPKLFGMHTEPGRSELDLATGTKAGRAHFGNVVGMAANITQRDFGRSLETPNDLSPHSSKVVKHLQDRGLVSHGADTEVTNEMTFDRQPIGFNTTNFKPVDQAEIAAGKATIRRTLRGRKRRS